jgi:sugar phosphate isomerase/epimerase
LEHELQPEIGLEGNWLWTTPHSAFSQVAGNLQAAGLHCTLHAPFFDLAPGGFDERVLSVSREKLALAFALIEVFRPRTIVCHIGYEHQKYGQSLERWLDLSCATWAPLLDIAAKHQVNVMFENTYETEPGIHSRLLDQLGYSNAKFCLDVGHLLAFAHSPWQPWLEQLQPQLGQLHLHDNNGEGDEHSAIGQGIFPFPELFNHLRQQKSKPVLTLEPHSEENLWLSLAAIEEMDLFRGMVG